MRALYHFTRETETVDLKLVNNIHRMLKMHKKVLLESPYAALPELTNSNGKECPDSCPSQAWSSATILDLIGDLRLQVSNAFLQ
jgi:glycogen debranching enzyme